jgi:hypothetical protein
LDGRTYEHSRRGCLDHELLGFMIILVHLCQAIKHQRLWGSSGCLNVTSVAIL